MNENVIKNVKICVVYDKVAMTYTAPMVFDNTECAVRWFNITSNLCQTAEPTDFELYEIGSYDADKAKICVYEKPDFIQKGEIIDYYRKMLIECAGDNNGKK